MWDQISLPAVSCVHVCVIYRLFIRCHASDRLACWFAIDYTRALTCLRDIFVGRQAQSAGDTIKCYSSFRGFCSIDCD